jgi:hypothetical protein
LIGAEKIIHAELEGYNELLKNHKKPEGWYYNGAYDFLQQEGKFFKSQELTEEERLYVMEAINNLGFVPQPKQCYYNANLLAINDFSGRIKYAEGLAYSGYFPIWHGWNTINGKVIDLTWLKEFGKLSRRKIGQEEMILGTFDKDRAYFGAEMDTNLIRKIILKSGISCSLLDSEDYKLRGLIFKQKFGEKVKFEQGGELAPNGKPSNLSPEQHKLVRTPAFKKWFGDWENSPETASKVVDGNGEPLVCYHGTDKEFNEFNFNHLGSGTKATLGFLGFYFTEDKSLSVDFTRRKWSSKTSKLKSGSRIIEVFLNIRNPYQLKMVLMV